MTLAAAAGSGAGIMAGLEAHGVIPSGEVHWNLEASELIGMAAAAGEGVLSAHGVLVTRTGSRTGRSPNDRFIVREPATEHDVWWGDVNMPTTYEVFERMRVQVQEHLSSRDRLFVQDLFAGADPDERLAIRVVTENAWHAAFAENMFIRPTDDRGGSHIPEFTVLHAPHFEADDEPGLNSEAFVIICFSQRQVIIGGMRYAGEMKVVGRRSAREDKLRRLQMVQDALSEQELVGRPEQLLLKAGEAETGDTSLDLAEHDSVPAVDLLPSAPVSGAPAPTHASMRTYHFTDEDLASRAADAVGEELARNLSQAVSTGNVTVIAPELYELAEKQKKRAKRSGASGTHDLMFGDIHHRPVVVMTFIAGVLLFAAWNAYAAGAAASGILALASVICLLLIFISRWRASSNELTLPDVMGMETPFALTMVGLSIVHFVGRQAPGSRMVEQLDLMVLIVVLVLLAGISLIGRRDLAMRIPSALEWIVYCLLASRIAGTILAGSMPLPLRTNPFAFDSEITWTGAWLLLEGVLFGIVVLWDWIEGMRASRGLPDARGAAGRGGWVVMITLLSFGPAALLAIALGLRRAFQWSQPAAAALDVLAIAGAWVALIAWVDPLADTLPWALIGLGLLMLAATAVTIPMRAQRWTAAWSWNAHGLLLLGLLLLFKWVTPFMSVALLALSLTIWVAGILQLRRSLRIWGAADLVLAIVAGLLSIQTVVDPIGLLLMLIALGVVLGIVAWLGQRYEGQLAVD